MSDAIIDVLKRIEVKLDNLLATQAAKAVFGNQPASGGAVFPPYGKSKGAPIAGASERDLRFYANGCKRSLSDESKQRFRAKERALLDAINAELQRQGLEPETFAEAQPDQDDGSLPF